MHYPDEILHAYLDAELPALQMTEVETHLASCPLCRAALAGLAHQREQVGSALSLLDPSAAETARPAKQAYRLLSLRLIPNRTKEMNLMNKIFIRPIWAVLTVIAVLAASFAFQPVRALAGNFLNLFRVQQITMLPMDMTAFNSSQEEPTIGEAMGRLFSDSMNITREPADPVEVASAADASSQAGFSVRLPVDETPTKIKVNSGPAFDFTVDLEKSQDIVREINPDIQLPQNLDGVVVSVDIPSGVTAFYGDCKGVQGAYEYDPSDPDDQARKELRESCFTLVQLPSPTVTTNPEVDPVELATTGLQVLGMSEADAQSFSESIDWTSTLVIPVPSRDVETESITVDGVSGSIIRQGNSDEYLVPGYTILWVKDGILYSLYGVGSEAKALEMANSLQ